MADRFPLIANSSANQIQELAAADQLNLTGSNLIFGDSSDGSSDDVLSFGASGDLKIFHQADQSRIVESGPSVLKIMGSDVRISNAGNTADYIQCNDGYNVKLYFNGGEKLATTNTGVNITGITTTTQLEVGTLGQSLVGITTILDEDNFVSNSATALATQQSIKAYVDSSTPTGSNLTVSADSGSNESINF